MENNNELLVKVDLLVSKITELEKQMDTLKNENVKLQNEINLEKKRMNNYLTYHLGMSYEIKRRLYTNGPF
jgi:cell division protein FtsB